jgi:hypothetical protein
MLESVFLLIYWNITGQCVAQAVFELDIDINDELGFE